MKFDIETNVVGWGKQRKGKLLIGAIMAFCFVLLVMSGVIGYLNADLVRDFRIAAVAHRLQGEKQEVPGDFVGDAMLPPNITWSMECNSDWACEYSRRIVPFAHYEKLARFGTYVKTIGFVPFSNNENFHIAGRMLPTANGYTVLMNERFFTDPEWNDARKALETLVHELVHAQGGNFLYGTSESLESKTSIATIEVLAAMCNYGDPLACDAFWLEIHGLARTSLSIGLEEKGLKGVYDFIANLLWRDDVQQRAYEKSMRHWSSDPGQLLAIRKKYSLVPYKFMIDAVNNGLLMDTGNKDECTKGCKILGMPMDDTAALLGGLTK